MKLENQTLVVMISSTLRVTTPTATVDCFISSDGDNARLLADVESVPLSSLWSKR